MPWKECKPMDERIRFIGRLLESEKMAPLCREFGIRRVTGCRTRSNARSSGSRRNIHGVNLILHDMPHWGSFL
jgi:hypothetical protein